MRSKIIVITLLISVLTTSVGLYSGYIFNIYIYKKELIESSIEDASLISNYLAMPMEFEAPERAEEILENLRTKSRIVNCMVFLPNDTLFAAAHFSPDSIVSISAELKRKRLIIDANYIQVYRPITYLDQDYGHIYLRAKSDIRTMQTKYLSIAFLLVIVMGGVAFFLAHFGQKPIVKPIEFLSTTMNEIAESKNYALRLAVDGKDEVSSLHSAFNKMLDAIQRNEKERDYALIALKENQAELIQAKEKAEANDQLKTAFLQNMSHEIRTPMNAIAGFSSLLNIPDLPAEKQQQYLSILQNSSDQLLSIVTDILTISTIETKQAKLSIEKTSINKIIEELLAIFNNQAKQHQIVLNSTRALSNRESTIYTDKTKITQIFTNLLSNAIKFTTEGEIEFGYRLISNADLNELEFFVRDTGIGIEKEKQQLIFERFAQADQHIHQLYGGTGLGLSICKGFINLLKGKLWVESELNAGSTFYFTIPYKPVHEVHENIIHSKHRINEAVVLVAEDEEFNYLYIEELLIRLGITIIRSKNGKEAIDAFHSNPNIDLILMDIKMPIMNGYQAAKLIKSINPDMPIVAQSAYALEGEIQKYQGVFDDYITKPISPDTMNTKMSKYLNT